MVKAIIKVAKYLRSLNFSAVLMTIVVSFNAIGFLPSINPVLPILIALFSAGVILLHGNYHVEKKCSVFLLYLPLTIILAQPDPIFQSWLRLFAYILLFVVASPLIQSRYARIFRKDSLIICCLFSIFIGVGSFIAYFLGYSAQAIKAINDGIDTDMYDVGRFSGIASQSMTLGPFAGIGALVSIYVALFKGNKIFYIVSIACLGAVMFSASRLAFIATIAGIMFIIYKYSKSRITFTKYCLTIALVGVLSFPVWKDALTGLQAKQMSHLDDTEFFDSRAQKFDARFKEIAYSPLIGVGFSAIVPSFGDKYNKVTGTIEPGSSWLAILSMTGIIGFILFIRIYKQSFTILKKRIETKSILLMAFFILISIHMLAEGYVFATGNPLCYYVSLIMGCGYDMKYEKYNNLNTVCKD